MKPTVGRIVHYYDRDGAGPYAAIVTGVERGGQPTLYVLFPSGQHHVTRDAEASSSKGAHVWTWPPPAETTTAALEPADTAENPVPGNTVEAPTKRATSRKKKEEAEA